MAYAMLVERTTANVAEWRHTCAAKGVPVTDWPDLATELAKLDEMIHSADSLVPYRDPEQRAADAAENRHRVAIGLPRKAAQ